MWGVLFDGGVRGFNKALRLWRACVVCEELISGHRPLCRGCRRYLYLEFFKHLDQISFLKIKERNIPVFYLWSWGDQNSFVIQRIIIALKDGGNPQLYFLFSRWLRLKLQHFNVSPRYNVFAVPSADRKHGAKMGQSVAKEFGLSFFDILLKLEERTQKDRGKLERSGLRIGVCKEKTENLILEQEGVLVDDVMVTGESLKACIETLEPIHIQYIAVWAEKQ